MTAGAAKRTANPHAPRNANLWVPWESISSPAFLSPKPILWTGRSRVRQAARMPFLRYESGTAFQNADSAGQRRLKKRPKYLKGRWMPRFLPDCLFRHIGTISHHDAHSDWQGKKRLSQRAYQRIAVEIARLHRQHERYASHDHDDTENQKHESPQPILPPLI